MKLLDAHYADAIPLDLLKTEQTRIATEVTNAETRLAALDNNYNAAKANLAKAMALIADCHAAYLAAPDKVRRQFNQAFFERRLIDDNYTVTGELAEPFQALLSEEGRQYVARRAEADRRATIDDLLRPTDQDDGEPPEPALAGAALHKVEGLKEKTMVGATGLEPVTPSL